MFVLFCVVRSAPTYFTIWLNDGEKLRQYLPQLLDQNSRFGDVIIVDSNVRPFVAEHTTVKLDQDVFEQAWSKHTDIREELRILHTSYNLIKNSLPAAASDILRFVAFMGLDGNEFVYHDVDIKFGNKVNTKGLERPFSLTLLMKRDNTWGHASMNWVMRAILEPTSEINLEGAIWNNDLISVIPALCQDMLKDYIRLASYYFKHVAITSLKSTGDIAQTAMDVVSDKTVPHDRVYFIAESSESTSIFKENYDRIMKTGIKALQLKKLVTKQQSLYLMQNLLQNIFMSKYYTKIEDSDDPYALADRHMKSGYMDLHGHIRGIFSFVLDFASDPVDLGAVSRKHNVDWVGENTDGFADVPTLDCEPSAFFAKMFAAKDREGNEQVWYDTDEYESYEEDEHVSLEEIEANIEAMAIDLDSPSEAANSILPSLSCWSGSRRRRRSLCPRDDELNYDIVDGVVLYENKWHVRTTSRYVIATDTDMFKSYKYTASRAVMNKIALLHGIVVSRLDNFLKLPSGKFTRNEVNFKYNRLLESFPQPANIKRYIASITPVGASMSEPVRRFVRDSFGLGYLTSVAFNTQYLTTALNGGKNVDLAHKIAMGTIGTIGLVEMTFYTSSKLYTLMAAAPVKYASVFSKVFKTFGVATAVYFGVESSIELSKHPENVEAWWWLSRSMTIFTPLNRYFIPIDIAMIVTKRIVQASWELSYKQNKLIMDYDELTNYHAMTFFGIQTSRTIDIQNNAIIRSVIVNPTISRLAEYLRSTDAKGVVGFPVTTVCKTTNTVVYNDVNKYVTDINSVRMVALNTSIDSLSTARMQTCLTDARLMCDAENPSFWDWFISLFVRASRVRYRGADLGVGCTLLDGSVLTGTACSRINAIERDIADRKRIVIQGVPGNRHSLPLIHPREYDFKFTSVSNGSITSTSTGDCEDMLSWSNDIAPYVLTKDWDRDGTNRFDYIGVPVGGKFIVNRDGRARVYLQKLVRNDVIENITVFGSADNDNDFVVVDNADMWDVRGGNKIDTLILRSGYKVQISPTATVVDDRVNVSNIDVVDSRYITNCTTFIQGNSTAAVFTGKNSRVVAEEGAIVRDVYMSDSTLFDAASGSHSIVHFNGYNNTLLARSFSIVVATINGSASVDIRSGAIGHVNVENMTDGVVEADVLSELYVHGLTDGWNITEHMPDGVVINNSWKLMSPTTILFLPHYHVILRRHARSTVVVKNLTVDVPRFLGEPEMFVEHDERVMYYIQTGNFTAKEEFKEYMINGNVSLTIPYQSRKRIDFYGPGHVETNYMMTCGQHGTCTMVAHFSCDNSENIVKICKAA